MSNSKSTELPWKIYKKNAAIFVDIDIRTFPNGEFSALLRSDAHFDSPQTNLKLEKEHLDQAMEQNAGILDFGDLFDAMQGPKDPRASKSGDKVQHDEYFNELVDMAKERYTPYARNWIVLGEGNHERSVVKHYGYCPTRDLHNHWKKLGFQTQRGSYSGWVFFNFKFSKSDSCRKIMYYTHGSRGSAPVTRGVIKTNRRSVYLSDPDIIVSGDLHHSWFLPIARKRIKKNGDEYIDQLWNVQCPSYKLEQGRWEEEKEFPPLPQHGAYWWKVKLQERREKNISRKYIHSTVHPAWS